MLQCIKIKCGKEMTEMEFCNNITESQCMVEIGMESRLRSL